MSAAGRVMLVTGASRGIGAAIARRAAQLGWRIGVNYVASDDAARHVVEAVRAAGSDAVSAPADVSDPAATAAMFDMVEHAPGPIRALVCNAGVDREAAVADATDEDVRNQSLDAPGLAAFSRRFGCLAHSGIRDTDRRGEAELLDREG